MGATSASYADCILPPLSTIYSNTNFQIATESEDLRPQNGAFFGSNANYAKVFDNNNLNDAGDTSSNCHVGVRFTTGHVGMLSQVKYFLDDITDQNLATFSGQITF
jgi:hypothetical protein